MVVELRYESEDRLKKWLLAALEVTRAVLHQPNPRETLRLVARKLREVSAADYVSISLADPRYPEGAALVQAVEGLGTENLSGQILFNNEQALWTKVARSGKGVVSRDITSHPNYNPPSELAEKVSILGVGMYLPMCAAGQVLGVMVAGWRRGSPYEEIATQEVPLMELFAGQVALALQQARAEMLVMQDRDRIARELQDVALNRLFAIGTHLHVLTGMAGRSELQRRLRLAIDDLDETIRQIGPAIFAVSESRMSGQHPVSAQLVEEVDAASKSLGFTPRLVVHGLLDHRLPARVESELMSAVREALANAATHEDVSSVEVNVHVTGDELSLTVSDDGKTEQPSSGTAVDRLRENARRLGGKLVVHAGVPSGMALSWRVPLQPSST